MKDNIEVYLFDKKPFEDLKVQNVQFIKSSQTPDGKWFITKATYDAYKKLLDPVLKTNDIKLGTVTTRPLKELVRQIEQDNG